MRFTNLAFYFAAIISVVVAQIPETSAMMKVFNKLNENIVLLSESGSNTSTVIKMKEDIYEIIQVANQLYVELPQSQKDFGVNTVAILFRMSLSNSDIVSENYMFDRLYRIKHTLKYSIKILNKLPSYSTSQIHKRLGENKKWITETTTKLFNKDEKDLIKGFAEVLPDCPPPLAVEASYPRLMALLGDGAIWAGVMGGAIDMCMSGFPPLCVLSMTLAGAIGGYWVLEILQYWLECQFNNGT